jgi:hypothetical protein
MRLRYVHNCKQGAASKFDLMSGKCNVVEIYCSSNCTKTLITKFTVTDL